jgi:hypothetical protein
MAILGCIRVADVLICIQYCPVFACRKCPIQVWLRAILSSSLTAVAGAIQSANIYCFWFKFRRKCTGEGLLSLLYSVHIFGNDAMNQFRLLAVTALLFSYLPAFAVEQGPPPENVAQPPADSVVHSRAKVATGVP